MAKNPIYTFDFTIPEKNFPDWQVLKKQLLETCKEGTFQLEEGELTGYKHYQGRVSLKKKARIGPKGTKTYLTGVHWSPTSSTNKDNVEYVSKDHTRIAGPWDITEEASYIPRQIREIETLRPWQASIISQLEIWNTRNINMIYCPNGNVGKSILAGYIRAHKLGRVLPPVNDYRDFLRMVCDLPTSRAYVVDMPRAMKKDKLGGFYSAIETCKDGYAYDDRYTFREKIFDCPNIWVFTNVLPEFELLSSDRWQVFEITSDFKLEVFEAAGGL